MGSLSFSQEPAVWIGLITALLDAVAVFFPGKLTADQKTAIAAVITIAVPIILSFVTRSQVTPVATLGIKPPPVVPAVPPAA